MLSVAIKEKNTATSLSHCRILYNYLQSLLYLHATIYLSYFTTTCDTLSPTFTIYTPAES